MAIQSQTVSQYTGFGNDSPQSLSEYYFGRGVRRGSIGLLVGDYLASFFTNSDYSDFSDATRMVRGKSRAAYGGIFTVETEATYMLFGDSGNNNIYQSYAGIFTPEQVYRVLGQSWFAAGMIVDPTNRLLYAGWQYLGMMNPDTANYRTGTISVTNGSTTVTGSGTTFVSGDAGKMLRVDGDTGTASFYKIASFVSATEVTLQTNYTGTTASGKGYTIFRAWNDTWKDFGTSISNMNDGTSFKCPTELYESTVLFGRLNNICTLDVTTDTITDDTTPAFNMPDGYDCMAIKANTNGILMGFNKQGRGTIVLWDNYSDRSIAPWIPLDDLLLGVERYQSGWIVMTARGIYYTNGYTIQEFLVDFMESGYTSYSGVNQEAFKIVGDNLYFGFGGNYVRTRGGLYRLNLKTKLVEFVETLNHTNNGASINSIFYSPDFNRIYVDGSGGLGYLVQSGISSSRDYYYISNELGVGENPKIAEQIRLPIQLSRFTSGNHAITFDIECRVNDLKRQLHNQGQVASDAANATTMTVDETTWPIAEVGDLVEFISGNNKGSLRGITAITGSGTSTAVYTLDAALSNNPATSDTFIFSAFKPVEKKSISAATELIELYFGIKNRYRGRHFRVMFIITNATAPLELLPFEFQYDDLGILE